MTESGLTRRLSVENPHIHGAESERVVGTILGRNSDALVADDRVELRGF